MHSALEEGGQLHTLAFVPSERAPPVPIGHRLGRAQTGSGLCEEVYLRVFLGGGKLQRILLHSNSCYSSYFDHVNNIW
jgi:hypothetical protein